MQKFIGKDWDAQTTLNIFKSYSVRFNEMAQALENGDLSLESFAWYCQIARNSFEACNQWAWQATHPRHCPSKKKDTNPNCMQKSFIMQTLYFVHCCCSRRRDEAGWWAQCSATACTAR